MKESLNPALFALDGPKHKAKTNIVILKTDEDVYFQTQCYGIISSNKLANPATDAEGCSKKKVIVNVLFNISIEDMKSGV